MRKIRSTRTLMAVLLIAGAALTAPYQSAEASTPGGGTSADLPAAYSMEVADGDGGRVAILWRPISYRCECRPLPHIT